MRLTCPNCDAQYEVPDEVIPTSGRDVQCSNCGKTWFQHHPDHQPVEDVNDLGLEADDDPDEEVAAPPPPPPRPDPVRKELDPAVADILREEAEAEFEARRKREAAQGGLESQPELGLDSGGASAPIIEPEPQLDEKERRALDARRRMARMRGEPEPQPDDLTDDGETAPATGSRRDMLPDIEEINSTLRSDAPTSGIEAGSRAELGAGGAPKPKGGFRRGFLTMVLLALVLGLLYVFAPQISSAVPAVAEPLGGYVAWVDQMRIVIDSRLQDALTWLDAQAAAGGES